MSRTTVATALQRIARLIPVEAAGSSRLRGDYAAVCTPVGTLPEQFRQAQEERTAWYLSHHYPADPTGGRVPTGELATRAPRYIVTSYGVPIAWVTLDGRTHYAEDLSRDRDAYRANPQQWRTQIRHRDAIRAAWPERFAIDSMGDPIGPWPLGMPVPAGWESVTA